MEIPEQIRHMAESMNIDVDELLQHVQSQEVKGLQEAGTIQQEPVQQEQAQTAEGVRTVPAESNEDRLTREKAVAEQELQQLRQQVQTAEEGRVIGSSGVGPQGQVEPPNLGSIEPGLRFAYLNGLISDEDLTNKIGPLLADLLKAHQGGVI